MADSLHRLQTATEDLLVLVPSSYRPALLQGGFCITLLGGAGSPDVAPEAESDEGDNAQNDEHDAE